MDRNPCFLLGGWNCLPMDLEVRKAVTKVVKDARVPEAIYALLIALPTTSRQLVTLLEPRKSPLDSTGTPRHNLSSCSSSSSRATQHHQSNLCRSILR